MESQTLSEEGQEKYPVQLIIDYPENSSRLLAILTLCFFIPKIFLLIPHYIVMWFLGIVSFVIFFIAQIAVVITGQFPKGMFDFILGTQRWQARVNAYFMGLTDIYPPFSF